MEEAPSRLRLPDFLLIAIYSFVLFGYAGISGRPLTMHEARLPETAREMKQASHWLLPMSGIRPWLERPPLPHWIVISSMKLFGHDDRVWIVRFPSAIMGLITVLLIAGISARWFGRSIGLLSGLVLATSLEFYQYSSLAEDDIYLGALVAICMALFISADFSSKSDFHPTGFFKPRPWQFWGFFALLGLTNLAKGPMLGIAVVASSVGIYLLWNALADGRWISLRRYVWFWGWLVTAAVTLAWPLYAYHRYPDVLANWKYDYLGRVNGAYSDISQPWFYYVPTLARAMLPWTPACILGLLATAGSAFRRQVDLAAEPSLVASSRQRAVRLLWCWAIVPLILFSIPKGKHHHYLIPFLAPWAILAAIGLVEIGKWLKSGRLPPWLREPIVGLCLIAFPGAIAIAWFHDIIPGPARLTLLLLVFWIAVVGSFFVSLKRARASLLFTVILSALMVGYCWAETFEAPRTDRTINDTAFILRARGEAAGRLFISADLKPSGNLDFFRLQFYSRPDAVLLQNLTFLRDEKIQDAVVYVISRAKDREFLSQLGNVSVIDQSEFSHDGPAGWSQADAGFTLFKLTFDPRLKRYPAPTQITNMQAMDRDRTGPWCGPPM